MQQHPSGWPSSGAACAALLQLAPVLLTAGELPPIWLAGAPAVMPGMVWPMSTYHQGCLEGAVSDHAVLLSSALLAPCRATSEEPDCVAVLPTRMSGPGLHVRWGEMVGWERAK